jgi:hypothetical protein
MNRYLDLWDFVLRPFGRCAWRNPNYLFGVQIEQLPEASNVGG